MTRLMEQALAALRKAYPGALLVTERIEHGMRRPCLQLLFQGAELKKEMGRRWRREEELLLRWIPPHGTAPGDEGDKLSLLLQALRPGARTEAAAEGEILCITLKTAELCFLKDEEAEKMKQQLLNLHTGTKQAEQHS